MSKQRDRPSLKLSHHPIPAETHQPGVLARFYHGAVYHRLPRQCRCCSHCTAHGDAVVTHILLPNIPTGRIKRVSYDCEPFRALAAWNIKREEGRKEERQLLSQCSFLAALRVYREQSRLLSPRKIELSLARVERSEMRLETRRKCSAPELRSLNCLLEELIKSILPERLAWGIEGNSCRGLRPIYAAHS